MIKFDVQIIRSRRILLLKLYDQGFFSTVPRYFHPYTTSKIIDWICFLDELKNLINDSVILYGGTCKTRILRDFENYDFFFYAGHYIVHRRRKIERRFWIFNSPSDLCFCKHFIHSGHKTPHHGPLVIKLRAFEDFDTDTSGVKSVVINKKRPRDKNAFINRSPRNDKSRFSSRFTPIQV